MAVPAAIPIIKKIATAVLSIVTDKKKRRIAIGIILGVVFILLLPILALMGIFSGTIDIGMERANEIIEQYKGEATNTMSNIEKAMQEAEFSVQRIKEAQALYMFSLVDRSDEEDFVNKYVGCFKAQQTDEELINAVNSTFGTNITVRQYTDAMQEIRNKYTEQEKNQDEQKETNS